MVTVQYRSTTSRNATLRAYTSKFRILNVRSYFQKEGRQENNANNLYLSRPFENQHVSYRINNIIKSLMTQDFCLSLPLARRSEKQQEKERTYPHAHIFARI